MDRLLVAFVVLVCLAGCSPSVPPKEISPKEEKRPRLQVPNGKVQITQEQRTTKDLPGSNGKLRLTLGDITAGQVMLSIATSDGHPVLGQTSVKEGHAASFVLDDVNYRIAVNEFRSVLIGTDAALLTLQHLNGSPRPELTEEQKIELLIESVRALEGVSFIRNDKAHTGSEAAEHLQTKWQWKKADIKTARDFIRVAASMSSTTGKPYWMRFRDGKQIEAKEWFLKRLAEIEDSVQPTHAADPPSQEASDDR